MEETSIATQPPVILAVDDNPRNLQLISALLSQHGFKVVVANSGENAMKYLALKQPDLILLDIMMPGMSGYEVCEQIRKTPSLDGIPVIFLTARGETSDIVTGLRLGAVDYITKPFRGEEVLARINTHLELQRNRKSLEQKNLILRQLSDELEQKNEIIIRETQKLRKAIAEKDRFFSILSHDLRAPLAGFLTATELLEKNLRNMSREEMELFIATMADSARQLNKLLENLLSWAQLQLEIMKPKPENIELVSLANSAIQSQQSLATSKDITIENRIEHSLYAYADYQMTHAILRNLISNAIKFTPRGGKITIEHQAGPFGMVAIAVTDNGIGMNDETLRSLFSIDSKVSRPGTEGEASSGLGLILCHDMALRNKGTLTASSKIGQGSTFLLSLPLPA
ncbi:MAG TPA: hybrid sensor histidine kinase/response regulator [Bacteroidales bacterium]|nr:hybrid sensor histidine kinase/response regulator [Bacteroidales bacterium]